MSRGAPQHLQQIHQQQQIATQIQKQEQRWAQPHSLYIVNLLNFYTFFLKYFACLEFVCENPVRLLERMLDHV